MTFLQIDKPVEPKSEHERERLYSRKVLVGLLLGIFLVITGGVMIGNKVFDVTIPQPLSTLFITVFFVVLISFLIQLARLAKYNLNPKDEYEALRSYEAKAFAFEFLSAALLITVALDDQLEKLSWVGALLIALGLSRIFEYWKLREAK